MVLLARKASRRTIKCTWDAYFVKNTASSVAVSPPPTTANSTPRNWGAAPSQIAQAEMPEFQKLASWGRFRRLAVAPVAMIRLWVLTVRSRDRTVNGR